MNRFKGLDLVNRMPGELWIEFSNVIQEAVNKTTPKEKKFKKAKWLSEEASQITEERRDAQDEAPLIWPPDANSWWTGKDPEAGKDWRHKEKRATEDEIVGWHHWFNVYGNGQTLGDGKGLGSLACCSPWDHKESDMTWWLNNNDKCTKV